MATNGIGNVKGDKFDMSEKDGFKSIEGRTGRVVVGKINPGTDMLTGLKEICNKHGIKGGSVISCLGSLNYARLMYIVRIPEHRRGGAYSDPIDLRGPIELTSSHAIICQNDDGELSIHFHGTIVDSKGQVWGGHFPIGGNIVRSTIDVVILEIEGVKMARRIDPDIGYEVFNPETSQ